MMQASLCCGLASESDSSMKAPVTTPMFMETIAVVPAQVAVMMPVSAMAVVALGFCFAGCKSHGTRHQANHDQ
jgi:hypothetical protein